MNALSLYVNTFRVVLRVNPDEPTAWSEVYGLMTCLRQSLLCCVCGKLLIIPSSTSTSSCQHNACKHCVGIQSRLNPICIWCSDYRVYSENVQLRLVLQCYKKMCKYILSSLFYKNMLLFSGDNSLKLCSIVEEGAELPDDYHYANSEGLYDSHLTPLSNVEVHNAGAINGRRTVYSILLNDDASPSLTITKSVYEGDNEVEDSEESDEDTTVSDYSSSDFLAECLMSNCHKYRRCRCGMTTQNPGKLTCCGQRCPCYVGGRACFDCSCRGCCNPQQINVSSTANLSLLSSIGRDDDSSTTSSFKESTISTYSSDTERDSNSF